MKSFIIQKDDTYAHISLYIKDTESLSQALVDSAYSSIIE